MNNKIINKLKKNYINEQFPIFERKQERLSHLFSKDLLKQKITSEIEEEWKRIQSQLNQGAIDFFDEIEKERVSLNLDAVSEELDAIDQQLSQSTHLPIQEQLIPHLRSSPLLNAIYQVGKHLLKEKQFGKSVSVFYLFTSLAPQVFDGWMGLGMAYQGGGELSQALNAYGIALDLTEKRHALPWIYIGWCHAALGNRLQAQDALKTVLDLSQTQTEFRLDDRTIQQAVSQIKNILN